MGARALVLMAPEGSCEPRPGERAGIALCPTWSRSALRPGEADLGVTPAARLADSSVRGKGHRVRESKSVCEAKREEG